jgi:hypothetical protein
MKDKKEMPNKEMIMAVYPKMGLSIARNNLRSDTQGRHQNDVYLRVTQEPEQVLVQNGATTDVFQSTYSLQINVRQVEAGTEAAVKN